MGAVHVRTPKNFVLEERLERYADAIETNPEAYVGDWRAACAPAGSTPFEHLHLSHKGRRTEQGGLSYDRQPYE